MNSKYSLATASISWSTELINPSLGPDANIFLKDGLYIPEELLLQKPILMQTQPVPFDLKMLQHLQEHHLHVLRLFHFPLMRHLHQTQLHLCSFLKYLPLLLIYDQFYQTRYQML